MTFGQFLVSESWRFLVLGVLAALAAFFSAAETALFSLSRGDLYQFGMDRRPLARLVPALMRRPADVLAAVLLCTDIVTIQFFAMSAVLVVQVHKQEVPSADLWGSVLAVGTFLILVLFAEVLPKTLAFLAPRRLAPVAALVLAPITQIIQPIQKVIMPLFVRPITRLFAPRRQHRSDLTARELDALLSLSAKRGFIEKGQTELLQEILELADLRVGDIMVPRVDMVAYEANGPVEGVLELVRQKAVTNIPVYEGDLDHIVGLLQVKELLARPDRPFHELLRPVHYVPKSAPLERVLVQFRALKIQFAVVVDEYGGTAGMITLEDIIEEIVGDIAEAREAAKSLSVQPVAKGEWLVDGELPIHEWAQAFPTELSGTRFSTVGGLVVSLLGHVPKVGQTATYRNIVFRVEGVRRRRISLLRVALKEADK